MELKSGDAGKCRVLSQSKKSGCTATKLYTDVAMSIDVPPEVLRELPQILSNLIAVDNDIRSK